MFFVKKLVCLSLFAFVAPLFAADTQTVLPKVMEGKWGQSHKKAEMELIEMKSTTTARLNAIFWDGCTRRGETTAVSRVRFLRVIFIWSGSNLTGGLG